MRSRHARCVTSLGWCSPGPSFTRARCGSTLRSIATTDLWLDDVEGDASPWVLDWLDLDVRRGECFGLLGPNGAGKTTTVEILEGLLEADEGEVEISGQRAHQRIVVRQGVDKDLARRIVKIIKDTKLKVQAAVQGEQVRVNGKKRDDLQKVIAHLKEQDLGLPLQFTNFRD